jgi:hypothetical protein
VYPRETEAVRRTFTIKAVWDDEARVFYSESDIVGLHIEAKTIEEFEEIMMDVAADTIIANHFTAPDFAEKPLKELVPAILWQRPETKMAAA